MGGLEFDAMVNFLLWLLPLDNNGLGGPPVGVETECPLSDSMDIRPGVEAGGIAVQSLDGRRVSGPFTGVPRDDPSTVSTTEST
jgi:hypothetical protein